ncbi:MAG: PEP/pyruvate-binding domain-containing protein [Patescibacteria group bacterium]
MKFTKNFKQLSKKDVGIAGGKGASLGEMTQAGIQVPPGFVVLADAFERFLTETDIDVEIESALNKVNYKDVNSVDQASKLIRDLIHDAKMPKDLQQEILIDFDKLKAKHVAVRSSATAEDSSVASWAGELESYLNTTRQNLLGRVKDCWSSLFTQRAIVYRREQGMRKSKVSVAVVIQKMIQSEISGICFTTHPVTKDKNQLIIEAGWGLGEAIVGGHITPDSYVINKKTWKIIDINISEQEKMIVQKKSGIGSEWVKVPNKLRAKQKFNNKQIIELAKLCAQIEKHYKFPCDIEWALENKKFYIVQSRPITTL